MILGLAIYVTPRLFQLPARRKLSLSAQQTNHGFGGVYYFGGMFAERWQCRPNDPVNLAGFLVLTFYTLYISVRKLRR